MGFQLRILLAMLLVIVLSLTGTMAVAWKFAVDQEAAYNAQRLIRKEASVERSLDYTLDRLPHTFTTADIPDAFSDRICELADIHGMDIALYQPDGRLLTQSSLQSGEGSELVLSLEVLQALEGSSDRIQGVDFGQAVKVYWNVFDQRGEPLGIVGVRYEKRALEAGDFRAFWTQLAPLYVVLFLGGAILAAFLSTGLMRDLRFIRDRMKNLTPGEAQTPIVYHRKDAIGELVEQYNALLAELHETVNELAKREREGAWRLMAMQVAHEIKNPLTPIKLGAQHVERAWLDQRPDFDDRLRRYCKVVSEQIDVLSEIAQDFSLIAAVGLSDLQPLAAQDVAKESLNLFRAANPDIEWSFEDGANDARIMASKPHLLRVFNNLLANAVDAVAEQPHPQIAVRVLQAGDSLQITVEDNGVGIAPDQLGQIFQPRFTLKKGGTGLGLTITQSIVNQLNGSISTSSSKGSGAIFKLSFSAAV